MSNTHKFSSIVGLSDEVRIPRLGRIRLGHINHNTLTNKTYPQEDPHFLVPAEVAEVYGNNPTELDIMFPVNDRSIVFPQALEYYGASKRLLCTGNGKEAKRWSQEALNYTSCDCPCPLYNNGCSERAHLMVILPKVKNQGGVYQIDTGSIQSITAINSTLNILAPEKDPDNGILGYFAMVPMKLRRVKRDIYPNGHHKTSYPLQISLVANSEEIEQLRARKGEILAKTRCWVVEEAEQLNPTNDTEAPITIDDQPLDQASPPMPQQAASKNSQDPPSTISPQVTQEPSTESRPADSLSPITSTPSDVSTSQEQSPPLSIPKAVPLDLTITQPQMNLILQHTRKIAIPDEEVERRISRLTKKEASSLITQLTKKNFRFFEQHESSSVQVAVSA